MNIFLWFCDMKDLWTMTLEAYLSYVKDVLIFRCTLKDLEMKWHAINNFQRSQQKHIGIFIYGDNIHKANLVKFYNC